MNRYEALEHAVKAHGGAVDKCGQPYILHPIAVLPFDSDEPEFIRGFEAGRLWEQLKAGDEFEQTIHATNSEMAIRMCESLEREFSAVQLDDIWTELHVEAT